MALKTATDTRDGVEILHLQGKLDAGGVEQFKDALTPLAENADNMRVVVDFSGVTFIASSGLRVVLQAVKSMKPRGAVLYAAGMNDLVASVFKTMGFFSFVKHFPTIEECLADG